MFLYGRGKWPTRRSLDSGEPCAIANYHRR
jgi:hypothetical protein